MDVDNIITLLAENPMAGDELPGTGGCRKLRIAGRGKGKSGGYRTISFYSGVDMPVILLTIFSKGERANLSKAECLALKSRTKAMVHEYNLAELALIKKVR